MELSDVEDTVYSAKVARLPDETRIMWDTVTDLKELIRKIKFEQAKIELKPVSASWSDRDQTQVYLWDKGVLRKIRGRGTEFGDKETAAEVKTGEIVEEPL